MRQVFAPDMKIKYPKNEKLWVTYFDENNKPIFIITSKPSRDYYYLYEVLCDGEIKKLGKATTPPELESKFGI